MFIFCNGNTPTQNEAKILNFAPSRLQQIINTISMKIKIIRNTCLYMNSQFTLISIGKFEF